MFNESCHRRYFLRSLCDHQLPFFFLLLYIIVLHISISPACAIPFHSLARSLLISAPSANAGANDRAQSLSISDHPSPSSGYILKYDACRISSHFSKMISKDPMPKKERLTLSELASYDDILTDALVDHVCCLYCICSLDVRLIPLLGVLLDHNSEESIQV